MKVEKPHPGGSAPHIGWPGPPASKDLHPALEGLRATVGEPVGSFYEDANRSGYWERHGWDLLLDYDRAQDVPGMVAPGGSFWASPNHGGMIGHPPVRVVEIVEGPPDVERLHTILTKRLARAGYEIVAWEFQKSTNGWHGKVRLNPTPAPIEAVGLQAVCGSDPLREACNLQRAREVERWARETEEGGSDIGHAAAEFWRTRWNVLYQPKPEAKP